MMKNTIKATSIIFIGIACIVVWSLLVINVGADVIVAFIGVKNGYIVLFFIALFGGMSSITGVSYAATIVTLAAGGLNPLLLGLASGLGISIGDTIYYFLGRQGRTATADTKLAYWGERFSTWLMKQQKRYVVLGIYCYTAFTPLPNDLLTLSVGYSRFPYLPAIIALVLGNFTLTTIIATFTSSLPV